MIVVRTFAIGVGALLLMMSALGGPQTAPSALAAPANDNFASAIAISTPVGAPGIVAVGDNTGASVEGGETASTCGGLNYTLWYTWTSPGSPGTAVLDTWGSTFDTVLAVYTGSAFPLTEVACNDDFAGTQGTRSATSFAYTPGTTYRIRVSSFGSGTGTVVLSMSLGAVIYVTDTSPFDTIDGSINLVEAAKIASGTLGRVPQPGELTRVLNSAAAGVGGADLYTLRPGGLSDLPADGVHTRDNTRADHHAFRHQRYLERRGCRRHPGRNWFPGLRSVPVRLREWRSRGGDASAQLRARDNNDL